LKRLHAKLGLAEAGLQPRSWSSTGAVAPIEDHDSERLPQQASRDWPTRPAGKTFRLCCECSDRRPRAALPRLACHDRFDLAFVVPEFGHLCPALTTSTTARSTRSCGG